MKKYIKPFFYWMLFIAICNVNPMYSCCRFFVDGVVIEGFREATYITEDKKFVYMGRIQDTLSNIYYKRYILIEPRENRALYRIHSTELWRFWRWRDYVTQPYWQQPYLAGTSDDEVHKILQKWWGIYEPYYGSIPPITHKDSVQVKEHFRKKI